MLRIMFVGFDEKAWVVGRSRASILVVAAMLGTATGEKKVAPGKCQFRKVIRILVPKMLDMAFMKNGPLAISTSHAVPGGVFCSDTVDTL